MQSAAGRPAAGSPSHLHAWGVVLCLSLVSGLLFLPAVSAGAATPSADLSLSGSVSPDPASGGDTLTFMFTVHNEGPDAAADTTLIGTLPPGLTLTSASTTAGSCDAPASTETCHLGTVGAGPADVRVSFVVVAADVDTDTLFDTQATVTGSTPDPDDTNNELVVTSSLSPRPRGLADLELTSVHNVPNPVTGGYDLGATATVTNLGPGDATGVTVTDALAPGESFVATGSHPSCTASGGAVTCAIGDLANGDVGTALIVTKTPEVSADTTIHEAFAVSAPEDSTPGNNALDIETAVRARRADFVAGYVPASSSVTWLNDATRWSHGDAVATMDDPTVAFVGIPGGGPGGPVVITERPCGAPFACAPAARPRGHSLSSAGGTFGSLVDVSVPTGYSADNPITGVFLDNWSELSWGWGPFKVSFQSDPAGAPSVLPGCGGWRHTDPPCVSSIGRSFQWWNHFAYGDLHTVVRFTNGGTFGRGR